MLTPIQRKKLTQFAQALVDQHEARIVIPAEQPQSGFWFGGGNMCKSFDGALYLCGRFRSKGDSRTGLSAGARGKALVVLRSTDRGGHFERVLAFNKADLGLPDRPVLSIEGSALHWTRNGIELFVSSEKDSIGYPEEWQSFQKANTGVWTIERLQASTIEGLAEAPIDTILACRDPRWLHVKDPVVHDTANGDLMLAFCTHPYSWTSSNSGYVLRAQGSSRFQPAVYDFFPRGFTWDVAMSRITSLIDVPCCGVFADTPGLLLAFYDGGECVRQLEEHAGAESRPRGYSCEELGGAAVLLESAPARNERLSVNLPLFVSPYGTGCSRYVDVLQAPEGFYATWQQSQPDFSQALVMNFLSWEEANEILT
jgi:hypothetical protein